MSNPRPPGIALGQPPRGPRASGLVMPQGTLPTQPGGTPLSAGPHGVVASGLPTSPVVGTVPPPVGPKHAPSAKPLARARMMFSALIGSLMAETETQQLGNYLRQVVPGNPQVFLVFTGEGKSTKLSKVIARDQEFDIDAVERELRGVRAAEGASEADGAALLQQAIANRKPPGAAPTVIPGQPPTDVQLDELPSPSEMLAEEPTPGATPPDTHPPEAK